MRIETKQFGAMDIEDDKIYTMPDGMPGFSDMKRFVLFEREELWPFACYQSLDESALCFYVMSPYLFLAEYTVDLKQAIKEAQWEGDDAEDIKLYVIVNTSSGVPEQITANLVGPLIVNMKRLEAVQLVLHNSSYSHQHRIFSSPASNLSSREQCATSCSRFCRRSPGRMSWR